MRAKEVVRDGVQQVAEGEFKQIIRRLEKIETELEEQGLLTVGTLELGDAKEASSCKPGLLINRSAAKVLLSSPSAMTINKARQI